MRYSLVEAGLCIQSTLVFCGGDMAILIHATLLHGMLSPAILVNSRLTWIDDNIELTILTVSRIFRPGESPKFQELS